MIKLGTQKLCIVPQIINLRPHLLKSIVHGFITNRKYTFYCLYQVRLSPDKMTLIHWIKIDHVLLEMIMIGSCGTVHYQRSQKWGCTSLCTLALLPHSFYISSFMKLKHGLLGSNKKKTFKQRNMWLARIYIILFQYQQWPWICFFQVKKSWRSDI